MTTIRRGPLPRLLLLTLAASVLPIAGAAADAPDTHGAASRVFINEFHYDNARRDVDEGVEIAAPAGTSLDGWSVALYSGSTGGQYGGLGLGGVVPNQLDGYGTVWFPTPGLAIRNGGPNGLALVDANGGLVQLLSYQGSFTAADGPAAGVNSTDIGVSETPRTPLGSSLQLTGAGLVADDFTWTGPVGQSAGSPNPGQIFLTPRRELHVVRADLSGLADSADKHDAKALTNAVEELDGALADEAWADDMTLSAEDGDEAFDGIRKAIHDLDKVDVTDVSASVVSLARVARLLAEDAVDAAASGNGDDKHLAKARAALVDAASELDDGRADKATKAYAKAWSEAEKATQQ